VALQPSPLPLNGLAAATRYRERIESDLLTNILPFWLKYAPDPKHMGFVGTLGPTLSPQPGSPRGALLTSRILWTFAAAFRRYRNPDYLRLADFAYADLLHSFHDRLHGGFYWSVRADGSVHHDRKQIYGQAFAIYSLSEYHAASGRSEPLDLAVDVYRLIETKARDQVHGGYFEARGRTWEPIADMRLSDGDMNVPKSQNTHLHVMEAFANLLRVWPDRDLQRSQADLLRVMLDRVLDASTGHLGLFFTDDWKPRSDRISYGHDIEAAWLLTQAAEGVDDGALLKRIQTMAVHIAGVTLAEGVDVDGGLFNQGSPTGLTDTGKDWWPQAEAVIGFLNAYQISQDERFLNAAYRSWDFIEAHLIDRQHGEWFRSVNRSGQPVGEQNKISFWKCPYHNGRTALEACARLAKLAPSS